MSISNWGRSISNWCRGNSDWLNVDIRLSWDLDINIRLSSNFLMHIFFSGDLDIDVWLSKGVQVSVCYGRIISSGINSSNWGSYSSYRLSSITISIWTSSSKESYPDY